MEGPHRSQFYRGLQRASPDCSAGGLRDILELCRECFEFSRFINGREPQIWKRRSYHEVVAGEGYIWGLPDPSVCRLSVSRWSPYWELGERQVDTPEQLRVDGDDDRTQRHQERTDGG